MSIRTGRPDGRPRGCTDRVPTAFGAKGISTAILREMVAAGVPLTPLGRYAGVDRRTIRDWLKEHGEAAGHEG